MASQCMVLLPLRASTPTNRMDISSGSTTGLVAAFMRSNAEGSRHALGEVHPSAVHVREKTATTNNAIAATTTAAR